MSCIRSRSVSRSGLIPSRITQCIRSMARLIWQKTVSLFSRAEAESGCLRTHLVLETRRTVDLVSINKIWFILNTVSLSCVSLVSNFVLQLQDIWKRDFSSYFVTLTLSHWIVSLLCVSLSYLNFKKRHLSFKFKEYVKTERQQDISNYILLLGLRCASLRLPSHRTGFNCILKLSKKSVENKIAVLVQEQKFLNWTGGHHTELY